MDGSLGRGPTGGAAAKVLGWIEGHIRQRGLGVGDPLPGEMDIARRLRVGRSSVREALGALKTLGLIESRRKGGIRLVRDPVLLELRHYFAHRLDDPQRHAEATEFRAVMEWGLGPLMFRKAGPGLIRSLRRIVEDVERSTPTWEEIADCEIRFHSGLTAVSGNRLAILFSRLYEPIFAETRTDRPTPADVADWVRVHRALVEPLARRNERAFLDALRDHTHIYMRLIGRRRHRRHEA
jgi:DNA-binding FadR family transcriptional regulator